MVDLASKLSRLPERRGRAPWPNYEYVRGWGVFGLPFDSGHVLALRAFPDNDFSPYRLETACPRYYGPATIYTGFARIDLEWSSPASLLVTMNKPCLEWNLVATETRALRVLNAVSLRLPMWTWQCGALLRARELLAHHVLHLGDLRLSGTMPSGHSGILMPQRMYFIDHSAALRASTDAGYVPCSFRLTGPDLNDAGS